jgi:hypothetical protein
MRHPLVVLIHHLESEITMSQIESKGRRRGGRARVAGQQRRRMQPTVMALEARSLLSTIVVNNPTDTPVVGQIDLRQAIATANTNGGNETITFDKTVFKTPQTITLDPTLGQLEMSDATGTETITGPKAGVTVSGGGLGRVFQVDSNATASISGLTITGGSITGDGGGLYNDGGTITLTNVTLSGNSASDIGGGVENLGMMTASNSTFSSDTALAGGGIFNGGMVTLTNCTFSFDVGGSASLGGGGGGLANYATMMINGCTFSGNSGAYGSGLYNAGFTSLTVDDSTFSGNSASVFGGGIDDEGGPLTVDGCTFSGNSASVAGGGLGDEFGGSVRVVGSTFSGNSAPNAAGLNVGGGAPPR